MNPDRNPSAARCIRPGWTMARIGERFAAGDERALAECHSQFGPLLLAYARRYVGPNDAEDVVQTVMIEAWRGTPPIRPQPLPSGVAAHHRQAPSHRPTTHPEARRRPRRGARALRRRRPRNGRAIRMGLRRAQSARPTAPGAARGTRTRILRRTLPNRDRDPNRRPTGHHQNTNGPRPEAPRRRDRNQPAPGALVGGGRGVDEVVVRLMFR